MCLSQKTIYIAILGDCGRYPMFITTAKRVIKYWCRILKMDEQRYVKKAYNMMKCFDNYGQNNWVTYVKNLLMRNGFGHIWFDQSVPNEKLFLHQFTLRLKDQYLQLWHSDVGNSSKLSLYANYKLTFEHEIYLDCVTIKKFRNALGKLRTSSHDLEIERGRYSNTERNQRICKLCNTEIETEFHFVLKCPRLTSFREKYIPSKFYQSPNINKFNILMSSKNVDIIMRLAVFAYCAFQERKMLLNDIV